MRNHVSMALGLGAGLALGLIASALHSATGSETLRHVAERIRPLGTLFLNLLQMVAIPLVATSLFVGVAGLGDVRRLGRLGSRTLGFFWAGTIAAIAVGFVAAALILPLGALTPEARDQLHALARDDTGFVQRATESLPKDTRFLVDLIPANPIRAAVDGALLPLIVFVTILAVAAAGIGEERRRALVDLADAATQALIRVVHWVLVIAPLGIFALVAHPVAQLGWSLLLAMLVFVLAVVAGLTLLCAAVYLPAARLLGQRPAAAFLRALLPPALMGFSTTSSIATLPAMFDAAEHSLRIDRGVASFVLPLGASVNRAGSALYQAVALLFVARLFGVPFGVGELFQAAAAVFLASLTIAPIPSASVVSLIPAFMATGVPLSGIPLLLGLDRLPDMFRTAANVVGHLTGAVVLDAVEGPSRS